MAHFAMPPKTYRGTERARQHMERLPSLVAGYRKTIETGLKALTDPAAVAQAREALRTLIVVRIASCRFGCRRHAACGFAAQAGYAWKIGSGGLISLFPTSHRLSLAR